MSPTPRTLAALALLTAGAAWLLVAVTGCDTGDGDDTPLDVGLNDDGFVELHLADAPAEFDDVILDIQSVQVHHAEDDTSEGWVEISSAPTTVNLLSLINGVTALLGEAELPVGEYDQTRLILGDENRVIVDGVAEELFVPSGQQSGFKIHHRIVVEEEQTYRAIVDLDAARSVHRTGQGQYILRPVMRMLDLDAVSEVHGAVLPLAAEPVVWTTAGEDTVQTFADTDTGEFTLVAMPPGTYDVHVVATAGSFADTTLAGVSVILDHDTLLETVTLRGIE